jgi:hypothetical protein
MMTSRPISTLEAISQSQLRTAAQRLPKMQRMMIFTMVGVNTGRGDRVTLTPADCEAMLLECSAIRYAAPSVDCHAQIA